MTNRERQARYALNRMGLALQKSRSRNPQDPFLGGYMIVDPHRNWCIAGCHPSAYSLNLEEVERWITEANARKSA